MTKVRDASPSIIDRLGACERSLNALAAEAVLEGFDLEVSVTDRYRLALVRRFYAPGTDAPDLQPVRPA